MKMTSHAYKSIIHLREGNYIGNVYEEMGILGAILKLCLPQRRILQTERTRYVKEA